MSVFVLIHGGFMGGWVWKPTVEVLSAAGHEVYAPSLDGCGERSSQVRPGITLTSQAEEIAKMLFCQDVHDAVVVSTSTGGLVAAKMAHRLPRPKAKTSWLADSSFFHPSLSKPSGNSSLITCAAIFTSWPQSSAPSTIPIR